MVGVGDFQGDGKADILWRNLGSGHNHVYNSGNVATGGSLATVSDLNWKVVGIGDFDGDGKSDILWRNTVNGDNTIWKSGNSATQQTVGRVADQAWQVVQVGDFQGDGKADIIWRNFGNGQNYIYHSGNAATGGFLGQVPDLNWNVIDGLETGDLLHGGAGNNTLIGTVNADVLFGSAGNDVMSGGRGADQFRYTAPNQGLDTITDFLPGADKVQVVGSAFGGLAAGALPAGKLVANGAPVASQAAQFLYNTGSGVLAFDADGPGGAAPLSLVTLVGLPALAAGDVVVGA
jgi:Ca2+-binding RTX toxin-like protein